MGELLEGRAAVGHLLRRAGFGLSAADAEEYRKLGFRASVRKLLDELDQPAPPDPPGFDPYEPGAIQQAWLDRMLLGGAPLAERLALFWHGNFATSNAKIQEPLLMWRQYLLFRSRGAGRFGDLVAAISRDVAMIRWLDGNANRKGLPNENFARELQELFTLGIGNYTETDIREVARAFTGWGSRHHDYVFTEAFHDPGSKTVHGRTGPWNGDDVIGIITSLPRCHAFIAEKLLRAFVQSPPREDEIAEIATVLRKTGGDIRSALFVIFLSPGFRAVERERALVRGAVEFMVGALRTVGARSTPLWAHGALERMGQILFRPPSVKGWTSGAGWLSSAAMVERFKAARRLGEAHAEAAAGVIDLAFDGRPPERIRSRIESAQGGKRVAMALACPEFQLA